MCPESCNGTKHVKIRHIRNFFILRNGPNPFPQQGRHNIISSTHWVNARQPLLFYFTFTLVLLTTIKVLHVCCRNAYYREHDGFSHRLLLNFTCKQFILIPFPPYLCLPELPGLLRQKSSDIGLHVYGIIDLIF